MSHFADQSADQSLFYQPNLDEKLTSREPAKEGLSLFCTKHSQVLNLADQRAFIGMSYGMSGVPVDVAGIFLAGLETKEFSIQIADSFVALNGAAPEDVERGKREFIAAVETLSEVFDFHPKVILSSSFMELPEYQALFQLTKEHIRLRGLSEQVAATVPPKFRDSPHSLDYPIHEIACTDYMRRSAGITMKIGPSFEKKYDDIMRALHLDISFAYIQDAFPLGAKKIEPVVHYIPGHVGKHGKRIVLDDAPEKVRATIALGPDEAVRALLRIASVASERLGRGALSREEIESLKGDALAERTSTLLLENLFLPYRRVREARPISF